MGLPLLVGVPCQLQLGERVNNQDTGVNAYFAYLLCPKLTPITEQPPPMTPIPIVEVPQGTGRYYMVVWVDDVGKGFVNEYRQAQIQKMRPWPIPIP